MVPLVGNFSFADISTVPWWVIAIAIVLAIIAVKVLKAIVRVIITFILVAIIIFGIMTYLM